MVDRGIGTRGLVLVTLLAGGGLLHAQPSCSPAPCITSLQSGLAGPSGPTTPTNGNAITAGTPGGNYDDQDQPGFFLYVNGNFDLGFNETVYWTVSGADLPPLDTISQTASQVVAFVPQSLYAVAVSATITVWETDFRDLDISRTGTRTQFSLLLPHGGPPITLMSNSLPFTVNPALASIGALPAGEVDVPYSQPFFTGGTAPFTIPAGFTKPAGLNYTLPTTNPDTSTINPLVGTPTTSGLAQPVTGRITDSWGNQLNVMDTVTINPLPTITTDTLPTDIVNARYQTTQLVAQGGTLPYTWTQTGLPTGLTLSSAGVVSGTPTVCGPFTAVVTVTDFYGQTASSPPLTSVIYCILTITTTVLPNGKINTPYTPTTLMKSGGVAVYTWSAPGLSTTGLTLSQGGVLSGTPTVCGNLLPNITLTDGSGQTATPSPPLTLTIVCNPLTITTAGLPSGTVGAGYTATLSGSGGLPPYSWKATGLPAGLGTTSSGIISGIPTQSGSSTVSVTLTDSSGAPPATATFGITINPAPLPRVQITSGSLPNGTVGVFYASLIGVTGGSGAPYTFSVTGSLPPGMQVANNGQLQGTPTTPGNYSFGVTATDSSGNSGSGAVSITIVAAPLLITTGTLGSIQAGSSFGVTFAATGGVPPYSFAVSGSTPPGATFSNGTLGGTVTTAGTYSFTITVTDSAKTSSSKSFTLLVTPAPLSISASLPSGTAGAAFSGQLSATGGTPPYTFSGSAGGGLSVSSSGSVSGTPTTAGTYPVSATVTDSLGATASGTYSVTINPSSLKVTTSSLPNGSLTTPYSATLGATGGTPPYSWSASGLPSGISVSSTGALSGTPTSPGSFTVSVTVKDSTGVSASANLALTILPAPLKITTTSISPVTLEASFSVGFGATGGTPPYTWTATGLPAGVTISSTGTLSGTPTAIGTSSISVNVADVNGLTASETLNLTVVLPAAPNVTFTGLPATVNPATQSTSTVTFSVSYPVAVTVNLTLTFAPLSGADDPNIQFSTGGRTATLTIPAGATASTTSIGVQTGTVAGTITITAQLLAGTQDITPTPPPAKTIVIAPAAPSITSVTATTSSTGFTVTLDGFDTTRAVTQVIFTFTPVAGANLQTTSVTIPATSLFSTWYQSSSSGAYGSQFSFTIPFTVTGNVQSIASVTVTLVNPTGTSTSMTATL